MAMTRLARVVDSPAKFPNSPESTKIGKRKRADSDSGVQSRCTSRVNLSLDEPVRKRVARESTRPKIQQPTIKTSPRATRSSRKSGPKISKPAALKLSLPTPSPTPSHSSSRRSRCSTPTHNHAQETIASKATPPRTGSDKKMKWHVHKMFRNTALKQPAWLTSDGHYPGFEFFDKPEEQTGVEKCPEGCDCSSEACPCWRNRTTCELGCRCSSTCPRRFPSCNCKGPCGTNCVCNYHGRDCGIECQCTTCGNVASDGLVPKFRIQPSRIPGAGEGLFAAESIKAGAFMGCYEGNIVPQSNEKSPQVIMDFEISQDLCIRPDPDTCMLFKVNHWPRHANLQFIVKETYQGRKLYAFARKDVLPGQEIFADYRTSPEFDPPASETDTDTEEENFNVVLRKTNKSYAIEPATEWQKLEHVSQVKIGGDLFQPGDDVFVNNSSEPPAALPESASSYKVLCQRLRHCWVGRIIEIRQRDVGGEKKSYAVIAWYDTPSSVNRKARKATDASFDRFEMVGTRYIEVQDFDTISGRADMEYVGPRSAPRAKKLSYRWVWDTAKSELIDAAEEEEVFFNVDPFKLRVNRHRS